MTSDEVSFDVTGSDCGAQKKGATLIITAPTGGERCRVEIATIATAPGEYRASIRVREPAISFDQSSTLTVKARADWVTALLWLGLGGLLGMVVAYLRTLFRTQAATFAAALREVQRYDIAAALARSSGLVPEPSNRLLDSVIETYLGEARLGRTTEPIAGMPALSQRITALHRWASLAQQSRKLPTAQLTGLRPSFASALGAVLTGLAPTAALDALDAEVKSAEAKAAGQEGFSPSSTETSGAVSLPDLGPFALAGVRTLAQLGRRVIFASLVEMIATFALFAVAALLVIWVDNDAWGTPADKLNTLLIGAGAFLGAAAIKTIREAAGP